MNVSKLLAEILKEEEILSETEEIIKQADSTIPLKAKKQPEKKV